VRRFSFLLGTKKECLNSLGLKMFCGEYLNCDFAVFCALDIKWKKRTDGPYITSVEGHMAGRYPLFLNIHDGRLKKLNMVAGYFIGYWILNFLY
jgi:hypothetical protein